MTKYDLLIFDFDGTLADTFPWFASVLNDVADRYRFRRVEAGHSDILRGYEPRKILDYLGLPMWKVPLVARHMRARMSEDLSRIPLFSGVPKLIGDLREKGITLALVSSNSERNIRAILGPESSMHFRYFECGTSMFGKASKARRVLAKSQTEPSRSMLIGDEIRDLSAARACGIAFGAVSWGYNTTQALAAKGPDVIFESVGDILEKVVG